MIASSPITSFITAKGAVPGLKPFGVFLLDNSRAASPMYGAVSSPVISTISFIFEPGCFSCFTFMTKLNFTGNGRPCPVFYLRVRPCSFRYCMLPPRSSIVRLRPEVTLSRQKFFSSVSGNLPKTK